MSTNCENCAEKCEPKTPVIEKPSELLYYEAGAEREAKHTRKWIKVAIAEFVLIVCMIFGFLIYESQYETYDYDQNGSGTNIIGDNNEVADESTPETEIEEEQING